MSASCFGGIKLGWKNNVGSRFRKICLEIVNSMKKYSNGGKSKT